MSSRAWLLAMAAALTGLLADTPNRAAAGQTISVTTPTSLYADDPNHLYA